MRKLRHEEIPRPDPTRLKDLPRHPIHVVVDNIRSIHNVGSIFRTSDAARIEHLYLTGYSGTPDNPGMHKAALGAQDAVPWSYDRDVHEVLDRFESRGINNAVLEITDSPRPVEQLTVSEFPIALVLGNEVSGVPDDVVNRAAFAIEIPQFGVKQSLNVSIAYGIAVFDLVRHYRQLLGLPPIDPV